MSPETLSSTDQKHLKEISAFKQEVLDKLAGLPEFQKAATNLLLKGKNTPLLDLLFTTKTGKYKFIKDEQMYTCNLVLAKIENSSSGSNSQNEAGTIVHLTLVYDPFLNHRNSNLQLFAFPLRGELRQGGIKYIINGSPQTNPNLILDQAREFVESI